MKDTALKVNPQRKKQLAVYCLVLITFVSRAGLGIRDNANLASRLHYDDSYYVHNISWHLSQGHGITIDGMHKTNGIQPLIAFFDAPFYLLGGNDKWLGLRLSFLLAALLDSLTVLLIYKILSRITVHSPDDQKHFLSPPIIGCILWTFLYSVIYQSMNGLETGLYSLCLLFSLLIYISHSDLRSRNIKLRAMQRIGLGLVLGLTVLARIDAVFLVLVFLGFDYFHHKERNIPMLFIAPAIALLVSSPWWLYNIINFGNLIPTSGQSESIGGASVGKNIYFALNAFADICSTFFQLPFYHVPPWAIPVWITGVFSIVLFLAIKFRILKAIHSRYHLSSLLPLLFFGLIILLYYVFFFHAPYFITRYIQPLRIYWILLISLAFGILLTRLQALRGSGRKIVYSGVIFIVFFAFMLNSYQYARYYTETGVGDLYLAGLWAQHHASEKIGMQQSGIASFMSDNIINLDGKVNAAVLEAMKKNERGKYILSQDLTYIVDWNEFAEIPAKEANSFGGNFQLIDSSGITTSLGILRVYKNIR